MFAGSAVGSILTPRGSVTWIWGVPMISRACNLLLELKLLKLSERKIRIFVSKILPRDTMTVD